MTINSDDHDRSASFSPLLCCVHPSAFCGFLLTLFYNMFLYS